MKKGASHVDWAIGTGLFVVFIMLTLIALRPGTEPMYKGDVLLRIIEDGLKNDTYYTIEKQLLSITPDVNCITNPCELRIRKATDYGLNPEWAKDEDSINKTAILNSTDSTPDEYKPFDLYNEYCGLPGVSCSSDEKNVLDFESHIKSTDANALWVLYSEDIDYKKLYEDKQIKRAGLEKEISKNVEIFAKDENGLDAGPPTELLDKGPNNEYPNNNFTYRFGVSETLKGFSEKKLIDKFKNKNYENVSGLKDLWNIPDDKEFRINITNLTTCTPSSYTTLTYDDCLNLFNGYPIEEQIPPGISVFVKEWKDWMLTPKGRFEPVKIHVELW